MNLESLDLLSPEITVFFFGKKRHKSSIGGILTILMSISCIFYISYMLFKIFHHKSNTSNSYRKYLDDAGYYSFNNSNINHYLQFHEINSNSNYGGYNTKYVRIIMHRLYNSYNNNPSLLSKNEHWVYGYCRKGIDIPINIEITNNVNFACLRYYFNNTINKYFSVDDKNNYKSPYLIHGSGKTGSLFLTTVVEKCNNNSKINEILNVTCGTNDEINNFLNSYIGIYLNILSHQVDPNNFTNPINSFFHKISNELSNKRIPVNDINLSPLQVNSYIGIIINSLKTEISYIFEENRKSVEDGTDYKNGALSIYNYWLQNNAQFFERHYKNFYDDVLPSIGGIIQLIFYLFYYINFVFNKCNISRDFKKLIFEWNKTIKEKKIETNKFSSLVNSLKKKGKTDKNHFSDIFKSKPKNFTDMVINELNNNYKINHIGENKDFKIYHAPKTPTHCNTTKFEKFDINSEIDNQLSYNKNIKIESNNLIKKNVILSTFHESNNNTVTNNSIVNKKNRKIISGTDNTFSNNKLDELHGSCSNVHLTQTNDLFVKYNNFIEKKTTKKDNSIEKNDIKSSKNKLLTKNVKNYKNTSVLNDSNSKLKDENKKEKSLNSRNNLYELDNSSINELLYNNDYFSILEYIYMIFCNKKNNAVYMLEKFRKKLISEEHFFKSNIYLYLFEKSFTLNSQKFDIVQLYENL